MKKTEREVILEAALEAAARQVLIAELKARPDLKSCPNFDLLADAIILDHHFGPNAETGAFQAHYDPERRYRSGSQLPEIIASMAADSQRVHLLRPAAPKWVAPTENPWLPEYFNLTKQGDVTRHDPELAEKWQAEAKRREHALRRVSNA